MADVITEALAHQWSTPADAALARRMVDALHGIRRYFAAIGSEEALVEGGRAWRELAPERRANLLAYLREEAEDQRDYLEKNEGHEDARAWSLAWAGENEAALQALEALAGEVSGG